MGKYMFYIHWISKCLPRVVVPYSGTVRAWPTRTISVSKQKTKQHWICIYMCSNGILCEFDNARSVILVLCRLEFRLRHERSWNSYWEALLSICHVRAWLRATVVSVVPNSLTCRVCVKSNTRLSIFWTTEFLQGSIIGPLLVTLHMEEFSVVTVLVISCNVAHKVRIIWLLPLFV